MATGSRFAARLRSDGTRSRRVRLGFVWLLPLAALLLLLAFAHHVARFFVLRPILKDAPRSSARISLRERLEPLAARLSNTSLLLILLFLVAMLLFLSARH